MAKQSNFIYCINSERVPGTDGNGDSLNAVGVLSVITPEFVPGAFSFSIILSVLDMDVKKENTIKIVFRDPDGKEIVNTNDIVIPPNPNEETMELPKVYQGLNMCMDLRNVIFEKEGLYYTEVIVNGNQIGKNEIYVKGRRKN